MTDLEMTKLCAEAIGMDWDAYQKRMAAIDGKWLHGYETPRYDPLVRDEQAMALVKRFNLDIGKRALSWFCTPVGITKMVWNENLNRAIVECVATMQKAA